jgi:hypothetical protein
MRTWISRATSPLALLASGIAMRGAGERVPPVGQDRETGRDQLVEAGEELPRAEQIAQQLCTLFDAQRFGRDHVEQRQRHADLACGCAQPGDTRLHDLFEVLGEIEHRQVFGQLPVAGAMASDAAIDQVLRELHRHARTAFANLVRPACDRPQVVGIAEHGAEQLARHRLLQGRELSASSALARRAGYACLPVSSQ